MKSKVVGVAVTTRVTLHSLPDGQVVVEKQALSQTNDKQQREAEWLAMARHSGVVQLIGVSEEPFTIRTAHAGSTTLRTARPDPQTAARLLATTAQTLVDLHERRLVHGNLTLDHIIVSGDNRTTLCSPDGTINDAAQDVKALGEIVGELVDQWRSEGAQLATENEWQSLAERLGSEEPNLTARRAHLAFSRLGPQTKPTEALRPKRALAKRSIPISKPSLRTIGAALAAFLIAGATATWLTLLRAPTPPGIDSVGAQLVIDGNVFQVGKASDVVVAVPSRCEGQPEAVLLDHNSVVWVFERAEDQQAAMALAQIPGARSLIAESDNGCGQVWATGPAGRSLVVGDS